MSFNWFKIAVLAGLVVLLCGCQEIRGPVWSGDGKRVAYTTYVQGAGQFLDTSIYFVEADDDAAEPQLVAKGAACPHWLPDNISLYYAGERDASGFYTKILKYTKSALVESPAILSGLHLTGFKMSTDNITALLISGHDARPGSAGTVEVWNAETGKRTPLSALGDMYSPVLLPDGSAIAYSQKPADSHPLVALCDLDGGQPRVLFPTDTESDPVAASYVIHPCPDRDKLFFYGQGSNLVWTMRRDGSSIRKFQIPDNLSSPVMVRIDDDSNGATLTLAQALPEHMQFQVHHLDFTSKKFTRMNCDSERLVGGHVADPHATHHTITGASSRLAWLSPAGLAIGQLDHAHYYPLTSSECIAASALQIKQNEPDKAVASALRAHELEPGPADPGELDRTDAHAYLAAKQFNPAIDSYGRAMLLYPVGLHGIHFLFSADSGLPRPVPGEVAATLKEMDALIAAAPSDHSRMMTLLRQGLDARSKGDYATAAEAYKQASPICPDDASVGGLRFLEAMCAFENGDLLHAGEKWEAAARTADFPQNQYAAGLAAIAYTLDGHTDTVTKAQNALQLPVAKTGPLASELAQLPPAIRGKVYRDHSTSKENMAPDNSAKTWVEIDVYSIPFASITPVPVQDKDGKSVGRRIGIKTVTASSVGLSGYDQPIFHIPCAITIPSFAPDKRHIAFAASGEVFPLPQSFCDVYVLDSRGTVSVGNLNVCYTGVLATRNTVSALTWTDALSLKVSGSKIDVFGGETPYTRTVAVPDERAIIPAKP